ncbi:MAG TPA: choice-of-anchor D domain-containing protein [Solirubrobacteraceae bacterium]|nr:choice-of-anchor D domain-containing protein [Solirubrobacteraceae bacterium]
MVKRSVPLAVLVSVLVLFAAAPAAAQPSVEASPAQVEFGAVDLHFGGNPQQNVKFTNNTPGPLLLTAAEVSGPDAASFQIVNDSCSANSVEAGESCSLEVVFKSGVRGAYAATLVLDVFGEAPVEVPLSASAKTGTLSPSHSQLTFSPIPYNPPGSFEGENRESESLEVRNSSDFGTQIESVAITGPDAGDFGVEWGNCENDLMWPSNSCGMGIRFRPSAPGVRTASLVMQSDSASGALVVPLFGEGLYGPRMTLDTTQALLGNVALGTSAQHTFTVTDTGDYLLYIQRAFLVTGTPLMFPLRSDSCSGQILHPGESCTVTVGFEPATLGEKSAGLLFITNTPTINVAGIDGVGVPGAEEVAPSLSTLLPAAPSAPASAPASAGPPIVAAPQAVEHVVTLPSTLSVSRPPRLYSLLSRRTLDPGADIQCSSGVDDCETLGFVVPADTPHSAVGFGRADAVLGSSANQLRAGQSMHVRIPLTRSGATRLKHQGHLRVRVSVVVLAGGAIVAQRSWAMRLSAAGIVSQL